MERFDKKRFGTSIKEFESTDMLEYASSIDLTGLYYLEHMALVNKFRSDFNKARRKVEEELEDSSERDTAHDGLIFLFKFLYDEVYLPGLLDPKHKEIKTRKNLERRIQDWLDNCSEVVGRTNLCSLKGELLVEAFPYGLELIMHTWYIIEEDLRWRAYGKPETRVANLSANLNQLAEHTKLEFKKLIFTSCYSEACRKPPDKFVSTGEMAFVMEAVYGSLRIYEEHLRQIGAHFDYFINQLTNKKGVAESVNGVPSMLKQEQDLATRLSLFIPQQIAGLSGWLTSFTLGRTIREHKALDSIYKEEAISFLRAFLGAYKGLREKELTKYELALKP